MPVAVSHPRFPTILVPRVTIFIIVIIEMLLRDAPSGTSMTHCVTYSGPGDFVTYARPESPLKELGAYLLEAVCIQVSAGSRNIMKPCVVQRL